MALGNHSQIVQVTWKENPIWLEWSSDEIRRNLKVVSFITIYMYEPVKR